MRGALDFDLDDIELRDDAKAIDINKLRFKYRGSLVTVHRHLSVWRVKLEVIVDGITLHDTPVLDVEKEAWSDLEMRLHCLVGEQREERVAKAVKLLGWD